MRERMRKFTGRPGNKIKIITDALEVKIEAILVHARERERERSYVHGIVKIM